MITNKDIRVENGSLIINGDPYPLDGQSPEAIMQIVKDNSDTTPTENSSNPVKSGGVKTYVDNAVAAKADTYTSSSRDAAQSFNVGTATSNSMFLLAAGYASSYQFGIVFVNFNGSSISYKSISSTYLTVDDITYDNGIISITFSAEPYTNARLIRLC